LISIYSLFLCRKTNKRAILIGVAIVLIIIAIVVGVVLGITLGRKSTSQTAAKSHPTSPPPLPTAPPNADGPYKHAVVAADGAKCSEIGRDIMMLKNGSAVDAAIAALFCVGVVNMHSAGIGGGGFMVVYNRSNRFTEAFDFREQAPGASHKDMYVNGSMNSRDGR